MKPEILERIRAMKRASQVARAGAWRAADAIDRVVLDADERHRRRIVLTWERGTKFLLDLADATALRDGDGLDNGTIICVVAKLEPLVEIAQFLSETVFLFVRNKQSGLEHGKAGFSELAAISRAMSS
jgi:urease accessory protein UreE